MNSIATTSSLCRCQDTKMYHDIVKNCIEVPTWFKSDLKKTSESFFEHFVCLKKHSDGASPGGFT